MGWFFTKRFLSLKFSSSSFLLSRSNNGAINSKRITNYIFPTIVEENNIVALLLLFLVTQLKTLTTAAAAVCLLQTLVVRLLNRPMAYFNV